jgi:cysteinyl-tRNA synthetase
MNKLHIYDSLSSKIKPFEPVEKGKVGMYVCGPTVYNDVHLGNVRTFLSFDLIFRYFKYLGYKVKYVRNITDVGHLVNDLDEGEDKISAKAKAESIEPMEVAHKYTLGFRNVMREFNDLPPSIEPIATGHIIEQIEIIKKLLETKLAYESNGSVYFDITEYNKENSYGELSGREIEDLINGSRDLDGQKDKRSPLDFALWKKASKSHIMRWSSPWSDGFPGWHLECSAMSEKYLGNEFDIHGGGMDLKFPHHECEIAQNVGNSGKKGAKYWVHTNMLTLNGKRMSKSSGNVLLPMEIIKGNSKHLTKSYDSNTTRFFIHQAQYRSILDFSDEALKASEKGHKKLSFALELLKSRKNIGPENGSFDVKKWNQSCESAMNNDFNSPQLIAHLFEASKVIQQDIKDPSILGKNGAALLSAKMDIWIHEVLGLTDFKGEGSGIYKKALEGAMNIVFDARKNARERKDWETSDSIRDKLLRAGIQINDGTNESDFIIKQ